MPRNFLVKRNSKIRSSVAYRPVRQSDNETSEETLQIYATDKKENKSVLLQDHYSDSLDEKLGNRGSSIHAEETNIENGNGSFTLKCDADVKQSLPFNKTPRQLELLSRHGSVNADGNDGDDTDDGTVYDRTGNFIPRHVSTMNWTKALTKENWPSPRDLAAAYELAAANLLHVQEDRGKEERWSPGISKVHPCSPERRVAWSPVDGRTVHLSPNTSRKLSSPIRKSETPQKSPVKLSLDLPKKTTSPIRVPLYRNPEMNDGDSRSPSNHSNSPLPLSIHPYFLTGSPLYYLNDFNKLAVHSPGSSTSSAPSGRASPALSSPSKRRIGSGDANTPKKCKATRKLTFCNDNSSPVSGTFIKPKDEPTATRCVEMDDSARMVDVTPEARAELEKIENKIGDYICQLCKEKFADAFLLAQHRCSRIVHMEYRCPECSKVFNCPANLASHRRWHKPKEDQDRGNNNGIQTPLVTNVNKNYKDVHHHFPDGNENSDPCPAIISIPNSDGEYSCDYCKKKFKRHGYLRKHILSHLDSHKELRCNLCGKDFSLLEEKLHHISEFHPSSKQELEQRQLHRCTLCGLGYPTRSELDKHTRQHDTQAFPCRYCNSTFFTAPGLTRHINKCHPVETRQILLLQLPEYQS